MLQTDAGDKPVTAGAHSLISRARWSRLFGENGITSQGIPTQGLGFAFRRCVRAKVEQLKLTVPTSKPPHSSPLRTGRHLTFSEAATLSSLITPMIKVEQHKEYAGVNRHRPDQFLKSEREIVGFGSERSRKNYDDANLGQLHAPVRVEPPLRIRRFFGVAKARRHLVIFRKVYSSITTCESTNIPLSRSTESTLRTTIKSRIGVIKELCG